MARAGIFIRDIQRETARYYGLPVGIMFERDACGSRIRDHAHPRQVAMCLADRLTGRRLSELSLQFRRDRKTVYLGIRAAEQRCFRDDAVKQAMRTITKRVLHA